MKKIIKSIISKFGYTIIRNSRYNELKESPRFGRLWNRLDENEKIVIAPFLISSKSQFAQDLFVISQIVRKNSIPNYFIEFGATDGITWSNTYILEKEFKWDGILCEPAKVFHNSLFINRKCNIDKRCVFTDSNIYVDFFEIQYPNKLYNISSPELSTIKKYLNSNDWASDIRNNNSINYKVETISLNDLLDFYNAPKNIGYLSIDTEGSEFDILLNFKFNEYKIYIISVEHAFDISKRDKIYELLVNNGYYRVFEDTFEADDIYMLRQ